MSSLLSQLRQAAAWGRAINIELHAQFPMPAPSSTSSLNTRRRRRRKTIFSMQVFHSLPNIELLVMTQISDTLPLGHWVPPWWLGPKMSSPPFLHLACPPYLQVLK